MSHWSLETDTHVPAHTHTSFHLAHAPAPRYIFSICVHVCCGVSSIIDIFLSASRLCSFSVSHPELSLLIHKSEYYNFRPPLPFPSLLAEDSRKDEEGRCSSRGKRHVSVSSSFGACCVLHLMFRSVSSMH